MSALRDEIAALYTDANSGFGELAAGYKNALNDALAIIDKHEGKPKCPDGCLCKPQSKPSDDRPARAVDVMAFTEIARQKAVTFGNYQGAVCELADAIDAIATAVLEGRQ